MKHFEAGLIIAGISMVVVLLAAAAWAILNFLIGPIPATVALIIVATIATMVVIVDWKTEKRS